MKGFLEEEMDQLVKWFARVYPQHKMTVHYKWKTPEHHYYIEINHTEKGTHIMPLVVPDAWFNDPEMEGLLHQKALERLQKKTMDFCQ